MSAPSPILLGRTTCSQPSAAGKGQDEPYEGSAATGHTDHQVRRSQHVEGRKQRRSWKWTFFQWSCSLVVVVLSIWLALTLGIPPYDCARIVVNGYHGDYGKVACALYERRHSYWDGAFTYLETTTDWERDPNVGYVRVSTVLEKAIVFPDGGFRDDPRFFALVISTALSGLAAIWMWLVAPTMHILLASYFLMLNWLEGLVTLSLLVCVIYVNSGTSYFGTDGSNAATISLIVLVILRFLLLLGEFITLQYVAQHRLKHIWPALNRARCGKCLGGSFWLQVVFILSALILGLSAIQVNQSCDDVSYNSYEYGSSQFGDMQDLFEACLNRFSTLLVLSLCAACLVPVCFLIWFLVVVSTLCRSTWILQRSFRFERKLDGRTLAASRLWVSLRGLLLQILGLLAGLVTTLAFPYTVLQTLLVFTGRSAAMNEGTEQYGYGYGGGTSRLGGRPDPDMFGLPIAGQCANSLANTAGIILLSGAFHLITCRESPPPVRCRESTCRCCFRRRRAPCFGRKKSVSSKGVEWEAKTEELAGRGMTLQEIVAFYRKLGDTVMASFQPALHTTNDVVRLAIIPLTASSCSSYAQLINRNAQVVPTKMVTHNWSNLFRDLVASIISDAVGQHTFELVAEMLSDSSGAKVLEEMLMEHGCLGKTYWICAFAVNQHIGICGSNPRGDMDPATMIPHPICSCAAPKIFNETPPLNFLGESINCEMNKFDDMMSFLSRKNRSFAEVVAVDASMDLFQRAWCIAEIAEAHRMGMPQSLKIRNKEALARRQYTLQDLRVENMTASREKDKEEILKKIGDTNKFNRKLRELIFDKDVGLLTAWKNTDALQQMEEVSTVLRWARLSQSVTDGQAILWQRWVG